MPGVILGVIVLAISVGFVVMMMVTEWSQPASGSQSLPLAEAMKGGAPGKKGKKPAPARKKASTKKK